MRRYPFLVAGTISIFTGWQVDQHNSSIQKALNERKRKNLTVQRTCRLYLENKFSPTYTKMCPLYVFSTHVHIKNRRTFLRATFINSQLWVFCSRKHWKHLIFLFLQKKEASCLIIYIYRAICTAYTLHYSL